MATSGSVSPSRRRVIVGVTGSVAAIKVPQLVEQLQETRELQAREYTRQFVQSRVHGSMCSRVVGRGGGCYRERSSFLRLLTTEREVPH